MISAGLRAMYEACRPTSFIKNSTDRWIFLSDKARTSAAFLAIFTKSSCENPSECKNCIFLARTSLCMKASAASARRNIHELRCTPNSSTRATASTRNLGFTVNSRQEYKLKPAISRALIPHSWRVVRFGLITFSRLALRSSRFDFARKSSLG
uniref:Uncharacterized protein n=1 Tax=Triticum urartu TaxID=4572 RepID=A0A8R7V5Z9_TRIUA